MHVTDDVCLVKSLIGSDHFVTVYLILYVESFPSFRWLILIFFQSFAASYHWLPHNRLHPLFVSVWWRLSTPLRDQWAPAITHCTSGECVCVCGVLASSPGWIFSDSVTLGFEASGICTMTSSSMQRIYHNAHVLVNCTHACIGYNKSP